ncbi:MAG: SIR2 family protein [Bacteroidia bacterium]
MSKFIDVIVDNIQNNHCIICLGPGIGLSSEGKLLHSGLVKYLQDVAKLGVEPDLDDFIIFKDKAAKTFFYTDLKKYYAQFAQPSDLHLKLAQIPGHAYINATPDHQLKDAFDNQGITRNYELFNKKRNSPDLDRPSTEVPLVYNFFGCIDEEDSLVITYDDLFDFLFSVLGQNQRLPRELKNTIRSGRIFLFLGFDFNKWYMKLLLRLFELHAESMPIVPEQAELTDKKMRSFYIDKFGMQFIEAAPEKLVDEVHKRFKELGQLREVGESNTFSVKKQVQDLVKVDDLEEALDILEEHLEEVSATDLLQDVLVLSGNFRSVKRQVSKGVLKSEDEDLKMNKLRVAILEITEEID